MLSQCLLGIVVLDKQAQFRDPNCTHIPQPHPQFFLQSLYVPDVGQLLKSHNENLEESHRIVRSLTGFSQREDSICMGVERKARSGSQCLKEEGWSLDS